MPALEVSAFGWIVLNAGRQLSDPYETHADCAAARAEVARTMRSPWGLRVESVSPCVPLAAASRSAMNRPEAATRD
ncbi:MAG TPA: hypothetical protein VJX92_12335 [Methylomirabilota bacterium]|nr:hypothetical protein [Methylomirabilota bacterium]